MATTPPHVTLCMAITQRDRMSATLQLASALGVSDFIPATTERTSPEHVQQFQTDQRAYRGLVEPFNADEKPTTLHAATPLPDAVSEMLANGATVIILWEEATEPTLTDLLSTLPKPPQSVALIVGPRDGLSPAEVAAAVAQGAHTATIGGEVLGSHVAAVAGVGAVLFGEFGGDAKAAMAASAP